ncbi:MAG: alpha/beta hydrolase-fold protein [Oscillospiraceae bacterium]
MSLKKPTAAFLATAFMLSTLSFSPTENASAASECVINTSVEHQTIRGFGGMNLPEWMGSDLTDAQRQTAFGNGDNELGLTVLRIFVNPDSSQWSRALPTAQFASKMGATVFASPWEPPSSLAESYSNSSVGKLHLPESNYGAYAKHLNDFGTYMKQNSVDLYSISVQNEPDYSSEWTHWTTDETTNFLANYGDQITSTRLMSPESFQYTPEGSSWIDHGTGDGGKRLYRKILENSKAFANCDVFGTHFYGTQRAWMDYPELENCGKEIWMTEVYVPNSDQDSANNYPEALQVSENIHNGLVVGNMSAYTWWYIRRHYGLMTEDGNISKRGYCMAQYSKYVRPGDVRIEATEQPADNVLVSAYKGNDNQVTIVAINKGSEGYSQQFSVSDDAQITNIDRYRTSSSENIAKTENLEYSGNSFWAQLPAESVSTFVVTLADTPVEPDENGYYFHDTFEGDTFSWEGHGASDVTLDGRSPYKDSEALLVQNRTGSWNGTHKALGSVFQAGQEYSFSVCVEYLDGTALSNEFLFSIQYTDSTGETKYGRIASGSATKGSYVQLANTNFKLPEDGKDFIIYVETANGTDNFYIDEAIGAVAGTKIDGPAGIVVPETLIYGDVNLDGVIDAIDLTLAKRGMMSGAFENPYSAKAADVNRSTEFLQDDIEELRAFLVKETDDFTDQTPETPSYTMEEYTNMVAKMVVEKEPDSSHNEQNGVQYGTIQSGTYYSTTCNRNKPYNILLPAGYSTDKQYPVLYCMHGYWENQDRMILTGNGTMYTRQIIGNAIAAGEAEDMIVVFPYIYSSATQDSCTAMDDANNAAYDNFINDLTVDLMPHIEKTYSVKTGRDNTAITGFSMGGRESLLIGMKRPDLFGYVGAICPAPGVTGAFKWNSDEEAPHLLFITAGSDDTVVYSNPETYHNNFANNGVPHIWHYVNGGYHGDNSIHAHIYNFVRGIFKAA